MTPGMRILYLEDDPFQRDLAKGWMEAAGHFVHCASDGPSAIRFIERSSYDIAVLDWEVPSPSGIEVLRWIRRRGLDMPVMFLTSHGSEHELVTALGTGADDYLTKPVRRLELLARVAALGRRAGIAADDVRVLDVPPYRLDLKTAAIWLRDERLKLKPREAQLAMLLFRKRGQVVSRAEMFETVWGTQARVVSRTIDTHISRLRKLLRLDGTHGWNLRAVYQRGYCLAEVTGERRRPWTPQT
jgi:DNA-binding response OmpR family regulator